MRIHQYESTVIINAALEDDQIELVINKIKDGILQFGGEMVDLDRWGRKRLAYQIKKSKIGYYVVFRFTAPIDAIAKLERLYRLDETIIRFLTLKLDKYAVEHLDEQKAKAAAAQQQETPVIETILDEKKEVDEKAFETTKSEL